MVNKNAIICSGKSIDDVNNFAAKSSYWAWMNEQMTELMNAWMIEVINE